MWVDSECSSKDLWKCWQSESRYCRSQETDKRQEPQRRKWIKSSATKLAGMRAEGSEPGIACGIQNPAGTSDLFHIPNMYLAFLVLECQSNGSQTCRPPCCLTRGIKWKTLKKMIKKYASMELVQIKCQRTLWKSRQKIAQNFSPATLSIFLLINPESDFFPFQLGSGKIRSFMLREGCLEAFPISYLFKCRIPALNKYFWLLCMGKEDGFPKAALELISPKSWPELFTLTHRYFAVEINLLVKNVGTFLQGMDVKPHW